MDKYDKIVGYMSINNGEMAGPIIGVDRELLDKDLANLARKLAKCYTNEKKLDQTTNYIKIRSYVEILEEMISNYS